MLGVEHGQMLPRDGFDILRARVAREIGHLRGVEIVRRRQPRHELQVFGGAQRVRRVQTEIADQKRVLPLSKRVQNSGGAHQNRAIQAQQKIQDAHFAGLENARAGDPHHDAARLHALHRRLQTIQIEIIERDAGGREFDRRLELFRGADEQMQFGFAARSRPRAVRAAQH